MFSLGFTEILIILIVVLVIWGPQKLPDLAKTIGKVMADFRSTAFEVKNEFEEISKNDVNKSPKELPSTTYSKPETKESKTETVDPVVIDTKEDYYYRENENNNNKNDDIDSSRV